jgi:hypothetical protein
MSEKAKSYRRWAKNNKEERLNYMAQWRRDNLVRACVHSLVGGARARSRKAGIDYDPLFLSVANIHAMIENDMTCPVCSVEMTAVVEKGKQPTAISLDRVRNNRGYVEGNVRVICAKCNTRKRDMTADDLRQILTYIEANSRD